jgi:hypothetical protein
LATITASGKPTKGGSAFGAGSNSGWNLNVTYNNDGTATGLASGSFAGTSWAPDVNVDVVAPGRSRHGKKRKAKAGKRVTKKKGRKKTARKTAKKVTRKPAKKVAKKARKKAVTRRAKPRTAARRAKAPARRKKSARR